MTPKYFKKVATSWSPSCAPGLTNKGVETMAKSLPNHLAIYACEKVDAQAFTILQNANLHLQTLRMVGCLHVDELTFYTSAQNQPKLLYAYCTID